MKNILKILEELNIELTDKQKTELDKEVKENYKTVTDYDNQVNKLNTANSALQTVKEEFDNFKKNYDGVDVEEMKNKITDLENSISAKTQEYETKLKTIELNSVIEKKYKELGGIDYDLAKALFNTDELMASNNQTEDVIKAVNKLKEDKPILFQKEDPTPQKKGQIIGGSNSSNKLEKPVTLVNAVQEFYNDKK